MQFYEFVFCILTYKNTTDIIECLNSISKQINSYKVVIVNSYYDDESKIILEEIASENNCDFLNVPNNGYGAGNNRGIEFIRENYNYDYLVISNPDIVIKQFRLDEKLEEPHVIAPCITTINGKKQNPYWMLKNSFAEKCIYHGAKNDNKVLYILGIGLNKIIRELGYLIRIKNSNKLIKVYAPHGSFMMISRNAVELFDKVYDENIFLFAEESLLAHDLETRKISTFMTNKIQIEHKEDGSVSLSGINENETAKKSIVYYYEKLHKR